MVLKEKNKIKQKLENLAKDSEFTSSRFKIFKSDNENRNKRLLRHNSMDNIESELESINQEIKYNINYIEKNINKCDFKEDTLNAINELRKQIKNKEEFMLNMCELDKKFYN